MMNNVEYDLDTSGGLMPVDQANSKIAFANLPINKQIQILIAPPASEEKSKRKEPRHPYYRRPGKGHNHDSCDACGEGGDLLCCDRCPASFHLLCHDPPLDEEDIPAGMWLCHSCKASGIKPDSTNNTPVPLTPFVAISASVPISKSLDPIVKLFKVDASNDLDSESRAARARRRETVASESENEPKLNCNNNNNNSSSKRNLSQNSKQSTAVSSTKTPPPVLKSLQTLITAAEHMNPKQFELPYELSQPIPFPGTDKIPTKVRRNAMSRKKPYELDNGLVPLPAKLCHECRKSCRKAPLLACDYCPLLFHQDCLDPPLTSLPSGRWMCPAHPQHLVDQKLLQTFGATERLRLWDRFCLTPVDQETVKLDFIRQARISQFYPKLRLPRVKLPLQNTVRVPDAVRHHYAHPSPLMPMPGHPIPTMNATEHQHRLSTKEEQEQWLSGVVAMQSSVACHIHSSSRNKEQKAVRSQLSNGGLSNGDIFNGQGGEEMDIEKPKLSAKLAGSTAQKIQASKLASLLQNDTDIAGSGLEFNELEDLDERLIRVLALQRLHQINSKSNSSPQSHQTSGKHPPPTSKVRVRAILYPLLPSEVVIPEMAHLMPYRTLSIGMGADMDVCLATYGHCNFVSAKHASIFFDESSQHYELLNYSEYGSSVDNVLYSCDFSDRPEPPPPPAPGITREPMLADSVKLVLDARRRKWKCLGQAVKEEPEDKKLKGLVSQYEAASEDELERQQEDERLRMSSLALKNERLCGCDPNGAFSSLVSQGAGWEGTALVNHGSYLRFGCMQFVFSITQFSTSSEQKHDNGCS